MKRIGNLVRLTAIVAVVLLLARVGSVLVALGGGGEQVSVPALLLGLGVLVGTGCLLRPVLRSRPLPRRAAVVGCLVCWGIAAVGLASLLGLPVAAGIRVGPLNAVLSPWGLGLSVVAATALLMALRSP